MRRLRGSHARDFAIRSGYRYCVQEHRNILVPVVRQNLQKPSDSAGKCDRRAPDAKRTRAYEARRSERNAEGQQ
jgi:hypothetical protein